jgi:WD40 repeat protein
MGGKESTLADVDSSILNRNLLREGDFAISEIGHYGVPANASTIKYRFLPSALLTYLPSGLPSDLPLHSLPSSLLTFHSQQYGILAVGTSQGIIKLFGKDGVDATLADLGTLAGARSRSPIRSLFFLERGGLLVAVSADSSIRVYNIALPAPSLVGCLENNWTRSHVSTCYHSDGNTYEYIYLGTEDGKLHVFNALQCALSSYQLSVGALQPMKESTAEVAHNAQITCLASCPHDENHLLVGYGPTEMPEPTDGKVNLKMLAPPAAGLCLWDVQKKKVLRRFDYHTAGFKKGSFPTSMAWHPNGKQFACGNSQGAVALFAKDKTSGVDQPLHFDSILDDCGGTTNPILGLEYGNGLLGSACLMVNGGVAQGAVVVLWTKTSPPSGRSSGKTRPSAKSNAALLEVFPHSTLVRTAGGAKVLDFAVACSFHVPAGDDTNMSSSSTSSFMSTSSDPGTGVFY